MATFKNQPVENLNSSAVTYLTSTTDSTIVLSILICNKDGSADADVTVNMLNSSDAILAKLASTITVPADSSLEILSNKLILTSGRKLSLAASSSGKLDASISYVEV